MKNFILTGTYNSFNKGDAIMQLVAASLIQKLSCDYIVKIHSPFSKIDQSFYNEEVFQSSRRRLIWGTFQILRAFLYQTALSKAKLRINCLISNTELTNFAQADLIIDLSGDMLTEDYGPHIAYSHFIPLLLAIVFKKKIFLCAQSIGPFKYTKFLFKRIFKKVELVTVRDAISLEYLQELGLDSSKIIMTADLAFLLEPVSRLSTLANLKKINLHNKKFIGVSLSSLIQKHYTKNNPLSSDIDFITLMAEFLDKLMEKYKQYEIVFVSHVTGPTDQKNDRLIATAVKTKMRHSVKAHVLQDDYRPEELKAIISTCDIFIGARMHANIAALSTAVPVLALSYSHKTPGIMAMFHQLDKICDIKSLNIEKLLKIFENLQKNRQNIIKQLKKNLISIRLKAEENILLIDTIINKSLNI